MEPLDASGPYSHRADPSVPDFDDAGPRTVMDAECGLCARGATWIARNDAEAAFKIIPLQSDLGRALMIHYGLDPDDPVSWLFLDSGEPHTAMQAVIRVARRLGGAWSALRILHVLPSAWLDAAYRLVARNRYRVFGRADLCTLPDPAVQERLLS